MSEHMPSEGGAYSMKIAASRLLAEATERGDQDAETVAWAVGRLIRWAVDADRQRQVVTPVRVSRQPSASVRCASFNRSGGQCQHEEREHVPEPQPATRRRCAVNNGIRDLEGWLEGTGRTIDYGAISVDTKRVGNRISVTVDCDPHSAAASPAVVPDDDAAGASR